jgi:hypothetical protein
MDGRSGFDELNTWIERGQRLGQLHDLEACIFERRRESCPNCRHSKIPEEKKIDHGRKLMFVVTPLLGFLFKDSVIQNGYLTVEDCPNWLTPLQKKIVLSRSSHGWLHWKVVERRRCRQ